MEVKACVFLGIEVAENLFWITHDSIKETCKNGHEKPSGKGPFCDKCGGKFEVGGIKLPTNGFRSLCEHLGYEDDYEKNYELIWKTNLLRSVYTVDPHKPINAIKRMILSNGKMVISANNSDKTEMNGVQLKQLDEHVNMLKTLAEVVGADSSEIRMYAQQVNKLDQVD